MARVHIIGAGLSGLSAAVALIRSPFEITLYEAADQAGGRCRSYQDKQLGRFIDNGNHLLLSANKAVLAYMSDIGSRDSLIELSQSRFPFLDLATDERWELRPGGSIPLWLFDKTRRVAGTKPLDYLSAIRLARATPGQSVAECIRERGPLWHRFWVPLTIAALNTQPEEASATLLWALMKETFFKGAAACRPLIARHSLAESLVDPAISLLRDKKAAGVELNCRIRALTREEGRIKAFETSRGTITLGEKDLVIIALPPLVAKQLLPEIPTPGESSAIVNAHYLLPRSPGPQAAISEELPLLGLVGGTADWLFLRDGLASLTVSAADELASEGGEAIATKLWRDTAHALDMVGEALPPHRVIKEKRATFKQTPQALGARSRTITACSNLFLAGDWTDTGLPATIESAVRSGRTAAERCKLTAS